MEYDPWSPHSGFGLDPLSLSMVLEYVGDCGWVARLVCHAFTDASCGVTASSIDSVERLALVRQLATWSEPRNLCNFAARAGHLEVLKWARLNGCPWDESTCCHAAKGGHLKVLQWARCDGCPWNEQCFFAADQFATLQWACPWDESTCAHAALKGHLEVLQWAWFNECPWDEWTCGNPLGSRRDLDHLVVNTTGTEMFKCPKSFGFLEGSSALFEYCDTFSASLGGFHTRGIGVSPNFQ